MLVNRSTASTRPQALEAPRIPPPTLVRPSAVDSFQASTVTARSATPAAPTLPSISLGFLDSSDSKFDGDLVGANGQVFPPTTSLGSIPPVMPNNGKTPTGETVVYVNGVGSELGNSQSEAQQIANATGEGVINLHNATDGFFGDLLQSVGDYFNAGKNPAVDSLTGIIYQHLKSGEPLHLVGHSQGTMIVSRALTNAKLLLERDGMTQAQAEKAMSSLKVETFAGAAPSYPDGPQYVHYMDDADPVARLGLDHPFTHPGAGAKVVKFDTGFNLFDPLKAHQLSNYLSHWKPFDQERAAAAA